MTEYSVEFIVKANLTVFVEAHSSDEALRLAKQQLPEVEGHRVVTNTYSLSVDTDEATAVGVFDEDGNESS